MTASTEREVLRGLFMTVLTRKGGPGRSIYDSFAKKRRSRRSIHDSFDRKGGPGRSIFDSF